MGKAHTGGVKHFTTRKDKMLKTILNYNSTKEGKSYSPSKPKQSLNDILTQEEKNIYELKGHLRGLFRTEPLVFFVNLIQIANGKKSVNSYFGDNKNLTPNSIGVLTHYAFTLIHDTTGEQRKEIVVNYFNNEFTNSTAIKFEALKCETVKSCKEFKDRLTSLMTENLEKFEHPKFKFLLNEAKIYLSGFYPTVAILDSKILELEAEEVRATGFWEDLRGM